ncbi:unnamed protein product [Leuciscus chuanchicus]
MANRSRTSIRLRPVPPKEHDTEISDKEAQIVKDLRSAVGWLRKNCHSFRGFVEEPRYLKLKKEEQEKALLKLDQADMRDNLELAKEPFMFRFQFKEDMEDSAPGDRKSLDLCCIAGEWDSRSYEPKPRHHHIAEQVAFWKTSGLQHGLVHQEIGGGQMERTAEKHDDDGEDTLTSGTRSPKKSRKKTADAPERVVKNQGKRPWNDQKRAVVKRRLAKLIVLKTVLGKQDFLMCIAKESPVLSARTWKDVKYFVYNEIVKVKRKLAL